MTSQEEQEAKIDVLCKENRLLHMEYDKTKKHDLLDKISANTKKLKVLLDNRLKRPNWNINF